MDNTSIFSKLDNKLTTYIRNQYLQSNKKADFKTHSFLTVGAIFLTDWFLTFKGFQFQYLEDFIILYRGALVFFFLAFYVSAFYQWRVLFGLRRDGNNTDKNLFFAESAGLYRKIVFYIALVPWFIMKSYSHFQTEDIERGMEGLKYALRADFYREAGFVVFESIIFSIILVELLRIFIIRTFSWSNKMHFAIVITISISLSGLRVFLLKLVSGHGII